MTNLFIKQYYKQQYLSLLLYFYGLAKYLLLIYWKWIYKIFQTICVYSCVGKDKEINTEHFKSSVWLNSTINLHKQYVDIKFFWYRNIEIWDLFLGFAMQEGLQTVKSPYKAMSVLQIKWYKEASRAMLYYVNWRHFNVITWEMCSEFGAKKGTSVIAVL